MLQIQCVGWLVSKRFLETLENIGFNVRIAPDPRAIQCDKLIGKMKRRAKRAQRLTVLGRFTSGETRVVIEVERVRGTSSRPPG